MPLPTRNAYAPTKAVEWAAHCALALLLASLLSIAFVINTPGVALADDTSVSTSGTGTITIVANAGNEGMRYDAYQIFTCDTSLKSGSFTQYVASNIEWPSDKMKKSVLDATHIYDNTTQTDTWSPQDAAEYIQSMIVGNADTRVEANGFAENLTKAVIDLEPDATFAANTETSLEEGFYLIVSHPDTTKGTLMGTSPIFTLLGEGQDLTITEKTSMPKITKTVAEDSLSGVPYADAQVGQELSYKLSGTLPDSITTFSKFYYSVADTLPAGIDLIMASDSFSTDDVSVTITNGDQTYMPTINSESGYTVSYDTDAKSLKVEFGDLKKLSIDKNSVINVAYRAKLNSSATTGSASGNKNAATITFGSDPQNPDTNRSTSTTEATVYTYGLRLMKVDKEDESTSLSGVSFTIQATSTDEGTNNGKYIKTDGTFGESTLPATTDADYGDYVFTTGADGSFSVLGLDLGTYTICELAPPSGYKTLSSDLVLTLSATKNDDGMPTAVTAQLTGGNGDGEDTGGDSALDKGTRAAYDSATGIVTITATNEKRGAEIELPFTGLSGITLVYVAGGAILIASLVVIVRRRLKYRD